MKCWTSSEDGTERQSSSAAAWYADATDTGGTSIVPGNAGLSGCPEAGTGVNGTGYLPYLPCTEGRSEAPMRQSQQRAFLRRGRRVALGPGVFLYDFFFGADDGERLL